LFCARARRGSAGSVAALAVRRKSFRRDRGEGFVIGVLRACVVGQLLTARLRRSPRGGKGAAIAGEGLRLATKGVVDARASTRSWRLAVAGMAAGATRGDRGGA